MNTENEIKELIKILGGTNEIYSFISSKGLSIKIASIYKWKNNGIPHRYRNHIIELAHNKNINIDKRLFNITDNNDLVEMSVKIPNSKNNKTIKSNNISYHLVMLILLGLTFLCCFFYFFNLNNNLQKQMTFLSTKLAIVSENGDPSILEKKINNNSHKILELKKNMNNNENIFKENYAFLNNSIKNNQQKLSSLENIIDFLNSNTLTDTNIDSIKIIIYLTYIKQNIHNNFVWSENIENIKKYISRKNTPENILKASQRLEILSEKKIFKPVDLKSQILFVLNNNNRNINEKKYTNSFLDKVLNYTRQFIKIEKTGDRKIHSNKKIIEKITEDFNNNNLFNVLDYTKNMEKNSNLENNLDYKIWKNNLENYVFLEESVDLIISWLIKEGLNS